MGARKYDVYVTEASQVHRDYPEWIGEHQAWTTIYEINGKRHALWAAFDFGTQTISFDGETWIQTVPYSLDPMPHDDYEHDPDCFVNAPMQREAERMAIAKVNELRQVSKGSKGQIKWTFEGTKW